MKNWDICLALLILITTLCYQIEGDDDPILSKNKLSFKSKHKGKKKSDSDDDEAEENETKKSGEKIDDKEKSAAKALALFGGYKMPAGLSLMGDGMLGQGILGNNGITRTAEAAKQAAIQQAKIQQAAFQQAAAQQAALQQAAAQQDAAQHSVVQQAAALLQNNGIEIQQPTAEELQRISSLSNLVRNRGTSRFAMQPAAQEMKQFASMAGYFQGQRLPSLGGIAGGVPGIGYGGVPGAGTGNGVKRGFSDNMMPIQNGLRPNLLWPNFGVGQQFPGLIRNGDTERINNMRNLFASPMGGVVQRPGILNENLRFAGSPRESRPNSQVPVQGPRPQFFPPLGMNDNMNKNLLPYGINGNSNKNFLPMESNLNMNKIRNFENVNRMAGNVSGFMQVNRNIPPIESNFNMNKIRNFDNVNRMAENVGGLAISSNQNSRPQPGILKKVIGNEAYGIPDQNLKLMHVNLKDQIEINRGTLKKVTGKDERYGIMDKNYIKMFVSGKGQQENIIPNILGRSSVRPGEERVNSVAKSTTWGQKCPFSFTDENKNYSIKLRSHSEKEKKAATVSVSSTKKNTSDGLNNLNFRGKIESNTEVSQKNDFESTTETTTDKGETSEDTF